MATRQHLFAAELLPDLLHFVSSNARARWPASAYLMTGDVAWRLPGSEPELNINLFYDGAGLAGYVWLEPPTGMSFDLDLRADLLDDRTVGHSAGEALIGEMFAWAEDRRRGFGPAYPSIVDVKSMEAWEQNILHPRAARKDDGIVFTSTAFERDADRVELLKRNGFDAVEHFGYFLARSLDVAIPDSRLTRGMRLRHVTVSDEDERVATHRHAWWPASGFDLDLYREIKTVGGVYDPELDIVLETEDGTFASYCIGWVDQAVGVGSFEPVGTRRDWRGKGVGREVIYEGLRRLKAKGMHTAIVQTAGFNDRALALYRSCGFELIDIERTFVKTLR